MSRAEAAAPLAASQVFAALGDPTRLSLVRHLSDGNPHSISALSQEGDMTRQAVTKHLRVLERAGLVRNVRAGRESRFLLRPETVGAASRYLDQVSAQWDEALDG